MKTLRIKDICDKGSSNLKQKDVENQNGVYPVFGASGLIGKIDTYHQNKDYIAIVKDGSGIGRVTFMPAFSSVIGTLQYILPKEGFNIKYISYCLQSLDLAHYKQGAAIPHIYFRDYGEYEVNVEENPDDQQRIVSYLDAEFAKIEALKANAEKQLQAAKDLFQAALKELLTPKEGWVEKKLVEEFCLKSGDYLPTKEQKKGNIPVYGGNGITGYHNLYNLSGEQILIGRVGALCGNIHYVNENIWVTDNAFVLTNISECWYKRFLVYELGYLNLNQFASQTAQPVISNKSMKDVIITQPKLSEQQRIADRLDALSANVKALQTNYTETITLCNDLKQALLKKVFG